MYAASLELRNSEKCDKLRTENGNEKNILLVDLNFTIQLKQILLVDLCFTMQLKQILLVDLCFTIQLKQ